MRTRNPATLIFFVFLDSGSPLARRPERRQRFFNSAEAFSSEACPRAWMESGSREENASNQEAGAWSRKVETGFRKRSGSNEDEQRVCFNAVQTDSSQSGISEA
jgi:hypothetical protein